jgi:spermidine/putrescine transport system ATP-binding protein
VGEFLVRATPRWESGTVAIHPEWIDLTDSPPAYNGILGIVRERFYRGDHVEIIVDPGSLRVQVNPRVRAAPGARLWLALPASRLQVLDD